MPQHTPNHHRNRAAFGVGLGVVMAIVAAVVSYFQHPSHVGSKWALLFLPALPLVAWGCTHLAEYRGYSGGAGCGLFIIGFFVAGFIGFATRTRSPITVGFSFVFMTLLPTVVLLALPKKSGRLRRRR